MMHHASPGGSYHAAAQLATSASNPERSVHTLHHHRGATPAPGPARAGEAAANGAANGEGEGMPEGAGADVDGTPLSRAPSFGGVGSPAAPYVSEFGSLLPRTAGSSHHLNKILLTHAPYMTKLESLASSATRCVRLHRRAPLRLRLGAKEWLRAADACVMCRCGRAACSPRWLILPSPSRSLPIPAAPRRRSTLASSSSWCRAGAP